MADRRDISRAHGRAVEELIKAAVDYDVYYGQVTRADADLTFPYLVIWPPAVDREVINLTASASAADGIIQITGVGRSPDEAVTAVDRALDAVQGRRPVLGIPGWVPHRIRGEKVQQPATKNEELRTRDGSPTYRAWTMVRVKSDPASAG